MVLVARGIIQIYRTIRVVILLKSSTVNDAFKGLFMMKFTVIFISKYYSLNLVCLDFLVLFAIIIASIKNISNFNKGLKAALIAQSNVYESDGHKDLSITEL